MDRVFEALSSSARRQILAFLHVGELTAGEIGARFDFSKPALSNHLRILEDAGPDRTREARAVRLLQASARPAREHPVRLGRGSLSVAGPLKRESRARVRKTPSK